MRDAYMLTDLTITRTSRTRLPDVDFTALGFGNCFSDHMFSMSYENGSWGGAEIVPYGPIALEPGNATLHYGQAVFEGLKAFMGADGRVRVFRPDMNAKRLRRSCERLCIPGVDEAVFLAAIDALVALDHAWIPRRRGQALYIRPMIFSTESHLEVRPSTRFRFLVITAPVRAYFDSGTKPVGLKVEQTYTRSAPGGTGAVKTAGNYAGSLYPSQQGSREGLAQVLWLDGVEHRYVEEVGAMNIFFHLDGEVVTPALRGTILPGITRDSVITLLRAAGHDVNERRISIDEVLEAIRTGRLSEAFGAGTAAIISPVGRLSYRGEVHIVNDDEAGELTRWLYDQITGIQLGELADPLGWNHVVDVGESEGSRSASV